jgi:hypothetical protein
LSRESAISTLLSYLSPCQRTSLASPSQRVWHPTPPPLYEVRGLLCTKRPGWCLKQGVSRAAKDIYLFGSGVIRPAGDADTNEAVVGRYLGHVMGPEGSWLGGLQIHSGGTKPPIRLSAARHSTELSSRLPRRHHRHSCPSSRGPHLDYCHNPASRTATSRLSRQGPDSETSGDSET